MIGKVRHSFFLVTTVDNEVKKDIHGCIIHIKSI